MALQYSTKGIEEELEQERSERKATFKAELMDVCFQRLEENIRERKYNQLIDSYVSLFHQYSDKADHILAIDGSFPTAKRQYYLAALTASQFFQLVRARFSSRMRSVAGPYNFKKNNFNFSKDAILANDWELALSITGEDTIEGLLLTGDYEKLNEPFRKIPQVLGMKFSDVCGASPTRISPYWMKPLKNELKYCAGRGDTAPQFLTAGAWLSFSWRGGEG